MVWSFAFAIKFFAELYEKLFYKEIFQNFLKERYRSVLDEKEKEKYRGIVTEKNFW